MVGNHPNIKKEAKKWDKLRKNRGRNQERRSYLGRT
jgi:hypothetical protein